MIDRREVPHPFLKWAGGKGYLIPQMKHYFPTKFNNYIEPFVGGGAVFFFLYRNKYLINRPVILSDVNKELINCYSIIKTNVKELIELLKNHNNEESYYYKIRSLDRNLELYNKLSNVEKASRTIYLNRCCYNGLYRVNSKGQFNTPFGRYKNPNFCNERNLNAVHLALQKVNIICSSFDSLQLYIKEDFLKICGINVNSNNFIYCDPPYYPISDTANFTSYNNNGFGIWEQRRLSKMFRWFDAFGNKVIHSNSYCNFIKNLYSNYKRHIVYGKRSINSDATKRGAIKEFLITNF